MSQSAGSSPVIQTSDFRRAYGDVVAVADFGLTVERGIIFGLLGPMAPARAPPSRC